MELSDIELINQCLDGKQEAFAEIVSRYKKLVYSVVYNMINDKQDINDISQEVFIRLYKSMDKYNPEYKFSTWTVRITTNYCLDVLRKKKVESVPIDEAIGLAGSEDTPEVQYISKERSERIRQAVASLPDKYRVPIILFHQNGLSYEEITKVLNEPMSIIKNRLYRARLLLRDKLLKDRKEEVL